MAKANSIIFEGEVLKANCDLKNNNAFRMYMFIVCRRWYKRGYTAISYRVLSREFGCPESSVKRYIKMMEDAGLLVDDGPAGTWGNLFIFPIISGVYDPESLEKNVALVRKYKNGGYISV